MLSGSFTVEPPADLSCGRLPTFSKFVIVSIAESPYWLLHGFLLRLVCMWSGSDFSPPHADHLLLQQVCDLVYILKTTSSPSHGFFSALSQYVIWSACFPNILLTISQFLPPAGVWTGLMNNTTCWQFYGLLTTTRLYVIWFICYKPPVDHLVTCPFPQHVCDLVSFVWRPMLIILWQFSFLSM